MTDPVGRSQVLEPKTGPAGVVPGPLDPLRTQGIGHAHQVDDIPPRIALLPFAGIGIVEISIQGVAGHLIVKPQAVVAHAAGTRAAQLGVNAGDKLRLRHAPRGRQLRGNTGEQAGLRVRQTIPRRAAVTDQRLADLMERLVGAQPGKLGGAIPPGVNAEGLIVMPVKRRGHRLQGPLTT